MTDQQRKQVEEALDRFPTRDDKTVDDYRYLVGRSGYTFNEYEEELATGFALGYAAAMPRWIPVAERLPEEGQLIVVFDGKFYEVGNRFGRLFLGAESGVFTEDYIKWMPLPLPAPPEKEGEDPLTRLCVETTKRNMRINGGMSAPSDDGGGGEVKWCVHQGDELETFCNLGGASVNKAFCDECEKKQPPPEKEGE